MAQATLKYSSAILGSDNRARCSSRNKCPEHDVAGLLQRGREDGILIAGRFEVSNLFQERRWSACPDFRLELSQGFEARVALGSGESGVEGDDASACGR